MARQAGHPRRHGHRERHRPRRRRLPRLGHRQVLPKELVNPSFEADIAAPWERFQDTGTHVYRASDAPAGTGAYSLRIVSDQTKWKKLSQPINAAYEPGSTYVLRGWGKQTGSVAGRAVLRQGSTTLCMIEYTTTAWTYKEVSCKLPASGERPKVWLEHRSYTVAGSAYFDDVQISGLFPYIVHDAMIGIPMAEFARLVAQSPDLSAYSAKASAYRAFLETEVVPRWEHSAYLGNTWNGTTYLQSPKIDTFSHTRPSEILPDNMALGFANLLTVLHELNGDPAYLDRAIKVAQWGRSHLVASGGAYVWKYATYAATMEDLSHANVDLSAYLEFHRRGQVFTTADMTALKNTFLTKMWNDSATAPVFSLYVDGTGTAGAVDYYLHSWLDLADWDPQVQSLVAAKYTGYAPANSSHLITLSRLVRRTS